MSRPPRKDRRWCPRPAQARRLASRHWATVLLCCQAIIGNLAANEDHAETNATAPAAQPASAPEPAKPHRPTSLVPSSEFITKPATEKHGETKEQERYDRLITQLEAGRKHRLEGKADAARATLVPILEESAPPEIQQVALLELGLLAEQEKEFSRAQQIYNQFLKTFSDSPTCPEVLLRQGLMYREMGTPTLALAKFYSVGSSALKLKEGNLETYRHVVLQAQTEIAETYFLQGKYEDAIDFFQRLLKQEAARLHRSQIHYRLVQCRERMGNDRDLEAAAREFLRLYPTSPENPEVRFLLANALKRMGRNRDALQEVSQLLVSQQSLSKTNRATWIYWQQRAGNEIANQLYQEGDYLNALDVYEGLLPLSGRLDWQLPLLYQIGLVYEKLAQTSKAEQAYRQLILRAGEGTTNLTSALRPVVGMAKWRADQLQWTGQAERTNAFFNSGTKPKTPGAAAPTGTPPAPREP
ncbi:MAG: tetratricopeptide repeat protein [Verrucomicrobiales bacterium]|nr:tetratricopeptide repeat protein [Verrucomicrobiales bacterium]